MKALLVISFGTTFNDTREKTIDRIEEDLSRAFPDRKFYRAWTSGFIRKRLLSRDGTEIDGPEEAFERMKADGVTDVLVQPTHIMPSEEYNKVLKAITGFSDGIGKVNVGDPLLTSEKDLDETAESMISVFGGLESGTGLVFMGHGSPTGPNKVYTDLEKTFRSKGYDRTFVGTVEAEPGLSDMVRKAKESGLKKVILTPLLVVAGDHAVNDLAGDGEDSWKSVFIKEGFEVNCVVKGLGEYEKIRNMFLRHAKEALDK